MPDALIVALSNKVLLYEYRDAILDYADASIDHDDAYRVKQRAEALRQEILHRMNEDYV